MYIIGGGHFRRGNLLMDSGVCIASASGICCFPVIYSLSASRILQSFCANLTTPAKAATSCENSVLSQVCKAHLPVLTSPGSSSREIIRKQMTIHSKNNTVPGVFSPGGGGRSNSFSEALAFCNWTLGELKGKGTVKGTSARKKESLKPLSSQGALMVFIW